MQQQLALSRESNSGSAAAGTCSELALGLMAEGMLHEAARAFVIGRALDPLNFRARFGEAMASACLAVMEGRSGRLQLPGACAATADAPEITVAIPVYNTDLGYLHECFGSVLEQTCRPAEILVVDDGSKAGLTLAYLRVLAESGLARVVTNPRNLSLGPAMNRALAECRTKYLLKLDSDDIARPDLVARMHRHVTAHPDLDVVGCQMQMFGDTNLATSHPARIGKHYVVGQKGHWVLNHTGVLLNRDSVLAVGGYGRLPRLPEDYQLWVRMMLAGRNRFECLQEVLVDYRSLPSGQHARFRRGFTRLFLAYWKLRARTAPRF